MKNDKATTKLTSVRVMCVWTMQTEDMKTKIKNGELSTVAPTYLSIHTVE